MLYDRDFTILTEEEKQLWDKAEKVSKTLEGSLNIYSVKQLYKYHEILPLAVYHYQSLFPNNFLSTKYLDLNENLGDSTLKKFNSLISTIGITERDILNFIRDEKAYFIVGSILKSNFLFGHHGAYLFREFPLPPNFIADFLIVGENSGGHEFVFVEFEGPSASTTADGGWSKSIRNGIAQIEDWDNWIDNNFSFLRTVFEKYLGIDQLLPKEFITLDKSRIHYVIVAGRRNDYKEKTYRLRRKAQRQNNVLILHYDNLIDDAVQVLKHKWY